MRERVKQNRPVSISDQAADWLLGWYRGRLSIAERHAYLQWLKASSEHIIETLLICKLYRWQLKTGRLKSFLTNEDSFPRAVELPPSPHLQHDEMFEAALVHAVRRYPVDTDTLVRDALAELAERRPRRRRARRRSR